MKLNKNIKFIFYQFLFWGVIFGFTFLPQIIIPKRNVLNYETWQLCLDYFMNVLFLIVICLGIRHAFNSRINLVEFNGWELTKFIFLFILAAFLYYLVLKSYNYFVLTYVYKRPDVFNHPSQKMKAQVAFAIIMCFIFFLWTLFYTVYKSTLQLKDNILERSLLESTLKESQLNALKGQINPHFMFNSLNNIRGLILENPEKSREMITRLSEMLRYSLTKSNIDTIVMEEELEMVDNFIAISKIQLEDRLQYVKEIQAETIKLQIPPMIIQLLIENAIKHGVSKLKEGGEVRLSTIFDGNFLTIMVRNSGKLVLGENSTQLGIKNIKERISLLYGKEASFTLEEIKSHVIAKINIPIV
ncbi:sensor histidine kinase [Flavobacterium sp. Arc2]|jgi:two-component system LytT family sensor kinase|uniref:sensor histidine kinase n=1 Tax=Flavobacterium sp. Arc2 TaxID=3046685 RepID=UPI00352FB6B4